MTDELRPDGEANAAEQQPRGPLIRVLAQFIKDLSFENPGLFAQNGQNAPDIELGIDVRVEPGAPQEAIFGVDLRMAAKARKGETVVFIAELVYSGVFQITSAREEDVEPILLIECPRMLFPFARRIMADITREGGHPPLMIDPIDFHSLYMQQRVQVAQAAATTSG